MKPNHAYNSYHKPLSTATPLPLENRVDMELHSFLISNNVIEQPVGEAKRKEVLASIESLVFQWVKGIAAHKGVQLAINATPKECCQLFVFGSQRLSVHGPDSDTDLLCVCPEYVTRHDFFGSFCEYLREESHKHISMVLPIPEAYTPVLKLDIDGLSVDMIFASLPVSTLPTDINLLENSWLRGQDDKGMRSLNGTRVAETLIKLVPNYSSFCSALRLVKLWARRRGIYSNILGFLGGINLAIMVAFISQLHPEACGGTIVQRFFKIFAQWEWPNPIMIVCPTHYTGIQKSVTMASWNPIVNVRDRVDIMPIVTPAFPQMNSAYNVGIPQFRRIQEEITRGYGICKRWPKDDSAKIWNTLCEPAICSFLSKCPRYLQIDILSSKNIHIHRQWFSWCESRIRLLIRGLEVPNYIYCHPISNCYHRETTGNNSDLYQFNDGSCHEGSTETYLSTYFFGLTFTSEHRTADITMSVLDFLNRVNTWEKKQGNMKASVQVIYPRYIPEFAFQFASYSTGSHQTPVSDKRSSVNRPQLDIQQESDSLPIAKTLWRETDTVVTKLDINNVGGNNMVLSTPVTIGQKNLHSKILADITSSMNVNSDEFVSAERKSASPSDCINEKRHPKNKHNNNWRNKQGGFTSSDPDISPQMVLVTPQSHVGSRTISSNESPTKRLRS